MVQPRIGDNETVGMMVRMPSDLRDRIKAVAETNGRSQNSEIVATLDEKYPAPLEPEFNYSEWEQRYTRSKEILAKMRSIVLRMSESESDHDALTKEFMLLLVEHDELFSSPFITNDLAAMHAFIRKKD